MFLGVSKCLLVLSGSMTDCGCWGLIVSDSGFIWFLWLFVAHRGCLWRFISV